MWKRFAILIFALTVTVVSITPAVAVTPKASAACSKLGSKYGPLVCANLSGKLKWQVAKKVQTISYSAPTKASVSDKTLKLTARSSSGLPLTIKSLTPNICTATSSEIKVTGIAGKCRLQLSRVGNSIFIAATPKIIEISIFGIGHLDFQLPGALLLSQQTYEIEIRSATNLPATLSVDTPSTCTLAGNTLTLLTIGRCTITAKQSGTEFVPAAAPVTRSLEISTDRVSADLPDTINGFQIKAIYVVPSDGTDNQYDINGVISRVLQEGTKYLNEELGLTVPIDSTSTGYDIAYMRSGRPSSYFLSTSGSFAELIRESKFLESPGANRKSYIFFVDTDTIIGPAYCGQAPTPGLTAIVAIGRNECGDKTAFFENHASQTWVHELIHNFGVSHVSDACDLMSSGQLQDGPVCSTSQRLSIDGLRKYYVQSSGFGTDITKLRVWNGHTSDPTLIADCLVNPTQKASPGDGLEFAFCPTGEQTIGPVQFCWTFLDSTSLEELVNGSWLSVGVGVGAYQPWGARVDWKCSNAAFLAPSIKLTVNQPGTRKYRWIVNGKVAEEMKIIWVQ